MGECILRKVGVCRKAFPPLLSPSPLSSFLLSPHFLLGQNMEKARFSIILFCAPRKRWLRRLALHEFITLFSEFSKVVRQKKLAEQSEQIVTIESGRFILSEREKLEKPSIREIRRLGHPTITFGEICACSGESNCSKNLGSTVAKQLQFSLLKHRLKDSQPGKSSPLRFRKGYFCTFWHLKRSPSSFG